MPEQLNPSLIQLRDRVKSLGTEITELVQDKNINGRETTTRIVKASKEAGVFFNPTKRIRWVPSEST